MIKEWKFCSRAWNELFEVGSFLQDLLNIYKLQNKVIQYIGRTPTQIHIKVLKCQIKPSFNKTKWCRQVQVSRVADFKHDHQGHSGIKSGYRCSPALLNINYLYNQLRIMWMLLPHSGMSVVIASQFKDNLIWFCLLILFYL